MPEIKSSSVCIDLDMIDSIRYCVEQLEKIEGITFDAKMMRLHQSQTGIGPATDLIVPIDFIGTKSKGDLKADIVFNITDYSKF